MYQSIPKRVYTTKENAMPKIPVTTPYFSEDKECNVISKSTSDSKKASVKKISENFKKMETDDLLLIGLLLLLLSEEGDNQILIAVLAFLLFS